MSEDKLVVLAIFAHADDEINCAGTLANHSEKGDEVHLAFLTKGENITNMDGSYDEIVERRRTHTKKIEDLLGVTVHFLDFPDSRIEHTVENGYKVAQLIRNIKPNIVITWNQSNAIGIGHPDHRNTSKLVGDAVSYARYYDPNTDLEPYRGWINLFHYHMDDSIVGRDNLFYVDVTKQFDKIRDFINIYQEAYGHENIFPIISKVLSANGVAKYVDYAEVFQLISGTKPAITTLPGTSPNLFAAARNADQSEN